MKAKKTKSLYRVLLLLLALSSVACSNTRHLQQGELLYVGAKVFVEDDSITKAQQTALRELMEKQLSPKPNSKFLGMRLKLYFYNLAGEPQKETGFRHWMKTKLGEAPVLFNRVDPEFIASNMSYQAQNHSYFNATTSAEEIVKNKMAKVQYSVKAQKPYLIRELVFESDSSALQNEIYNIKDKSLLKKGDPFNLDKIKNERIRIDSHLKEKGYFYFSPNNIIVQVDSTAGRNEVDLRVKVKDDIPSLAKQAYTIDKVIVFADYSINDKTVQAASYDTISSSSDFIIVDSLKRFKPKIFDRTLYFKKDDVYKRTNHNLALNRLVNLGVFKFVKNQFVLADSSKHSLNAFYYLTPEQKKSLRLELLAKTNSAGYAGSEINLNWRNRNLFKGAELLVASVYGGMDFQMSAKNKGFDMFKLGTDLNLIFPQIIAPFSFHSSNRYVPKTKLGLGGEHQNRSGLYALYSLKASFGYLWKGSLKTEHDLNLIEINYVKPEKASDLYLQQIAQNPSLRKILDRQLIFGPTYSYTFTNTMQANRKHTVYYKGTVDLSANLTGLIWRANEKTNQQKSILGVPFSQYVKQNNDFRYYWRFNKNAQIASRIIAGIGIPYGNSKLMPSSKQFFVGGTNSIRAFRSRSVGPGSFNSSQTALGFMPDQLGDIVLEMNIEYRRKLFSIVHGALFVDAGNIWLLHELPDRPGGKISKNFYKEIAMGAGFGLRFDLSFLILRTDFAFPLRVPYLPEKDRWTMTKINFGSAEWYKENLSFNLAIGYPF